MRRLSWIALLAGFALAASPAWGAPRLVTWKHTTSRFVRAADSPFNNVPADAPAKPQALPVNVLLPDGFTRSRRYPVLYLMHGHGDSYWSWYAPSNGDLLKTAAGFPGIVVMPEGGQGWYADWWNGGKRGAPGWESYHLRELVPLVEKRLPVRRGRRWHAIAGLSMGGEATMYYASQLPGYFGSAAAFSPPVSIQRPEWPTGFNTQGQDFDTVFGPVDGFYAAGHNPLQLVENLRWTRLFVGVGDGTPQSQKDVQNVFGQVAERELRMHADDFVPAARATGASVDYDKRPGVHDWPYWRQYLKDAIAWGFFKPVVWHPSKWTFKTAMQRSSAWGYSIAFSKPPSALETFSLAGHRLSASGSGRVTIRGPGRCRLDATLPFKSRACTRRISAAASPEVHAARSCKLSAYEQRHLGASYVTSLHVKKTTCKTGKAVVRAYHKCRRAHGWKGKCKHRVKGYSCKRHILDSSSFQYDATVTCRRGAKRVTHTYTQNK